MKNQLVALISAAALTAAAHQAGAAVIVSNLDPANYNGDTQAIAQDVGQAITMGSQAISLTSVLFPETTGPAPGQTFDVYSRNSNGTWGGDLLFAGFTLDFDSTSDIETATVNGSFVLLPDTSYYFVLVSSVTLEGVGWNYTKDTTYSSQYGATLPATDTSFVGVGDRIYYNNLADGPQVIQVDGTPVAVPEPSAAALIGLALAGGLVFVARRRAVV